MRISDWSSDVCSSDLVVHDARGVRHIRISTRVQVTLAGVTAAVMGWTPAATATVAFGAGDLSARDAEIAERDRKIAAMQAAVQRIRKAADAVAEIGRATCREKGCQYV